MEELRSSSNDYCNYLKMSEDNVISLLEKVRPLIEKEDTVLRTAITAEERLAITICFLAIGRSYEDLTFSAIISPQALAKILPETCRAIY
jgi:biotin synthase-like enzyme